MFGAYFMEKNDQGQNKVTLYNTIFDLYFIVHKLIIKYKRVLCIVPI